MFKVFLCVATQHDHALVVLAALVCIMSAMAAFFLYSRVPTALTWRRALWLCLTGLVAGAGVWTTHFVAMLAFKTGLATGYGSLETLGSLGVAVLSATFGFAVGSARPGRLGRGVRAIAGGLIVGLGIALMHYVGMAGYRTEGVILWNPGLIGASVLTGTLLSAAALWIAQPGAQTRRLAVGAGLLSLAITGMHFMGMAAVTIVPDPTLAVPTSLMSDAAMVVAAVSVTTALILAALGGVAFDTISRNGHLRRLREALDVMPEGLAFFDMEDRLITWNAQYAEVCAAAGATPVGGMSFAELLEAEVSGGGYPDALGRERQWSADRWAAHRGEGSGMTQRTAAGRWLRTSARRTRDGGTVCVIVDVTELKRGEAEIGQARDKAEELARRAEAAEAVAGLGHWRLDAHTREVTWSPELFRIYGMDEDTPLKLEALMAMTHADDFAIATARLDQQLKTGEPDENSITRIVRPNGEVRFLAGNSRGELGPDGEVLAVIGAVVDVTAQKLAEAAIAESEARFRHLADNAPDMITECDLNGVLTYVSPASLAITGYRPEELVGRPFTALTGPEDARRVLEMCQTVFASKGKVAPWAVEFVAYRKTGEAIWLECKPSLTADPVTGRFTGVTDVIRDITPRKDLEVQLRQAQADAEAAAAVKAEFLANMSHELRTPLTSIIGFTGLAREQAGLSELTRTYVDRVAEASRALLCTVNDILDFSKLEAGQVTIQREPVALGDLTRAALDLFVPQAAAKDLSLTLDEADGDLVLALDPDRLRQILLNLVGNAVKFTKSGGVTLRSRYDDRQLRVEVIDSGEGVSPDKQDRLFKRFSQVDGSRTRVQGGTGLGLAICKGLVEAMDGTIGVDSPPGGGACFWFQIPAEPANRLATIARVDDVEGQTFAGARVLVVDDHPMNRELARLFLAGVGVDVAEAGDGEEAVRMAAAAPFDVILMDLQMPKLDGRGALRRLRAEPGPNSATPVLAFTADAHGEILERLPGEGFQGCVAKPLDPATLIAAVARAITAGLASPSSVLAEAS